MVNSLRMVVVVVALGLVADRVAAQPSPPQTSVGVPLRAGTPLNVQVTVSRAKGEKTVSRVPYGLVVNASLPPAVTGKPSHLRIGAEVAMPIVSPPAANSARPNPPETSVSPGDSGPRPPVVGFNYRPFGTNIDCSAVATDDGRFVVSVAIEDSSVYLDDQAGGRTARPGGDPPILRSFRFSNDLTLRDGQSVRFVAASDRISGETITVDVAISLVK